VQAGGWGHHDVSALGRPPFEGMWVRDHQGGTSADPRGGGGPLNGRPAHVQDALREALSPRTLSATSSSPRLEKHHTLFDERPLDEVISAPGMEAPQDLRHFCEHRWPRQPRQLRDCQAALDQGHGAVGPHLRPGSPLPSTDQRGRRALHRLHRDHAIRGEGGRPASGRVNLTLDQHRQTPVSQRGLRRLSGRRARSSTWEVVPARTSRAVGGWLPSSRPSR
jgi:hypothetical protein